MQAENEVGRSGFSDSSKPVQAISSVGPPHDIKVFDISQNSVTLSWQPPISDGGSRIASYETVFKPFITVPLLQCVFVVDIISKEDMFLMEDG